MREFIYAFGYEGPEDYEANEGEDTDFESIGYLRISAPSREDALRWGRVLSDWYVMNLLGDRQPGRWSAGRYAAWIVDGSRGAPSERALAAPPVLDGHYPEFAQIRAYFRD